MSLKSDAIFDKIATRITKIDPSNRTIEHVFKFKITSGGKVVKTWMLDLKAVKLYVGDADAECTLTISDEDMVSMGNGTLPPKDALAQDKLDVDGDMTLALKLEPFVSSL